MESRLPTALVFATIVGLYAALSAQTPAPAAGAEWTTPAGTVEGTRFSSLKQITAANVRQLREEFRFTTGVRAGHEGAPLVVNNTMYVVSPFPNRLFALDLNRPGQTHWVFDPRIASPATRRAATSSIAARCSRAAR
jgi:alcohol dehydrogenase (cytochrome c)